jgi:hypothetical protein
MAESKVEALPSEIHAISGTTLFVDLISESGLFPVGGVRIATPSFYEPTVSITASHPYAFGKQNAGPYRPTLEGKETH